MRIKFNRFDTDSILDWQEVEADGDFLTMAGLRNALKSTLGPNDSIKVVAIANNLPKGPAVYVEIT